MTVKENLNLDVLLYMVDNQLYALKTDSQLVAMTLANQDNFLYLVQRYEEKLLRYTLRISNISYEEGQDVLQEVFIKVYKNLNNFDQSLKFSSWIYRIAHNEVISHYRKAKIRPEPATWIFDPEGLEKIISDLDINQEVDRELLKNQVGKVLNKLDPKYREVLILRFLEEQDYREISDILKKPVGTVGTLLNRAKKQFKEILESK